MSNLEKMILNLNKSLSQYVFRFRGKLNAYEQGEHIVRRVVPVKDLHSILQGESLLQGS
jgi:hypothetical protein